MGTHYSGLLLEAVGGEWAEFKMLWLLFCSLSGLRGGGGTASSEHVRNRCSYYGTQRGPVT